MPKKKSFAFNPIQIKDGWIVRLYKDGRIKSKIALYETKHPKSRAPLAGIEPATLGLEVQRSVHWTTEAYV